MNKGLKNATIFFYFLSPNSMNSVMAKREWQSALKKSINNELRFIPVRIADCNPQPIFGDIVYIDLYGDGLDDAIAKMKSVVNFTIENKPLESVKNLIALVSNVNSHELTIEIKAQFFCENVASFAFAFDNNESGFIVAPTGVG
jgi:hypothetical protein